MILKMRCGPGKVMPVTVDANDKTITFNFPYNERLKDEIKSLSGARWSPEGKYWYATNNLRNRFVLSYLARAPKGREGHPGFTPNPYSLYERELISHQPTRSLMSHQGLMYNHAMTAKRVVWAADMGVGKTLASIEVMEAVKNLHNVRDHEIFYVAPKSATVAVQYELRKWKSKAQPHMFTYEGLRKIINEWPKGKRAPKILVCDECSRLKTPTAQRTQAAFELVLGMLNDHLIEKGVNTKSFEELLYAWPLLEDGPYIVLMSGTPAPKSPVDWWSISEVTCAGFLKERDTFSMQARLAVLSEENSPMTGGKYKKLITWRDSPDKCTICGGVDSEEIHKDMLLDDYHQFTPGINEVEHLYKRLSGLVLVINKKDCLDLPDKIYIPVRLEAKPETLRATQLLDAKCSTAIEYLTQLRELSDGFLYKEETVGTRPCDICHGKDYQEVTTDPETGESCVVADCCPACGGSGQRPIVERKTIQVPCPKEDALSDLLEQHEEYARLVIYAGFTGSVDRCVEVCHKKGWATIRVDGRGVRIESARGEPFTSENYQGLFLDVDNYPHPLAFVGQPGAGGMGLTLTASPSIVFWSNDFNGESRMQAEDRIHRPGCKGANIYDLIHLPQDELVIENLKKKRTLQDMSLGRLRELVNVVREDVEDGE